MKRPIITIPTHIVRMTRFSWDIDWRGQSLGETSDGTTRTIYNAFPRWIGEPELHLNDRLIAEWRAVRAAAQGRAAVYRVPMVDPVGYSSPFLASGIPWDNGQPFDTGAYWRFEPYCLAVTPAARGATTLTVDTSPTGDGIAIGQILSANDWPFVVTSVRGVTPQRQELTLQPPLREPIAAGARIDMQAHGLFEAVDDTTGMAAYRADRISKPVIQLREVLVR